MNVPLRAASARVCSVPRFDSGNQRAERKTWWVLGLTLTTMVVEIIAGMITHSMALLADGWHMSSHALALGLTGVAYVLARRYANDGRFAFGTWKIEVLASFASALLLGVVASLMVFESVLRLMHPLAIDYRDAMLVALTGLVVNLVSAWLLRGGSEHAAHHQHRHMHGGSPHDHPAAHRHAADAHDHPAGHDDHDDHEDHGGHGGNAALLPDRDPAALTHAAQDQHDLNLRGAYLHVLADAATSVAAIVALAGGLWWNWAWLDPVVGCAGAVMVFIWALGLARESATVLLDREMDIPLVGAIRARLEAEPGTRVADLHLWRVGRAQYACIVSLESAAPRAVPYYRQCLADWPELAHVTVEVLAPAG